MYKYSMHHLHIVLGDKEGRNKIAKLKHNGKDDRNGKEKKDFECDETGKKEKKEKGRKPRKGSRTGRRKETEKRDSLAERRGTLLPSAWRHQRNSLPLSQDSGNTEEVGGRGAPGPVEAAGAHFSTSCFANFTGGGGGGGFRFI
jgi:hypothetical protein